MGSHERGATLLAGEATRAADEFRHEAMLYAGIDEFAAGTLSFIRDGLEAGERTLVVVSAPKIDLLRDGLDKDADEVSFADMAEIGHNPARIIPAWQEFVDRHSPSGRRFRGIGEPIDADRSPAALAECQRHEALLNVVFDGSPAWWLLCPYDTDALGAAIIDEARRTHPWVAHGASHEASATYDEVDPLAPFGAPLADPPPDAPELTFGPGPLRDLRAFATRHALAAGLEQPHVAELVLALNEIATNSIRHGGGDGTLRVWRDGDMFICEVRDSGVISEALAGRVRPGTEQDHGRGLWLANQLCDLVQVRSSEAGSVVRLHRRVP